MKQLIKRAILGLANRSTLLRRVAAFVAANASTGSASRDTYRYLKEKFIENGLKHEFDKSARTQLVSRFERIDREVQIGTTPTDGLFLAEMLLNVDAEGAVVECGCYAGESSAKLSILARLLEKELIVFDSFEGLPVVEQQFAHDQHCRRSWSADWWVGRYAAGMDEVRDNIERHGEISVCKFVKGWFKETLVDVNLPKSAALVFADVDLATSARDCFVATWPIVSGKGIYVTHDVAYIGVLQELLGPGLWKEKFKTVPPILFGAGYGLCNQSPHLGYMVKGDRLPASYLNSITIDK